MEEVGLLGQLGINWRLLLSQAFNFTILLFILWNFVYKPIINILKERNKRIIEGLKKAEEANIRLGEVDIIAKEKLKEADQASINIIKTTEDKARVLGQSLQKEAEDKQKELMKQIESAHKKQQEESKNLVAREAAELIKQFIVKTVELKPTQIDEALINRAVLEVKNEIKQ